MIVLDASAAAEALIGRSVSPLLIAEFAHDLHAPAHIDVEVMSVLRGVTLAKKLSIADAESALATFRQLPLNRHPLELLSDRMWALRHQFTSYDAAYIALAEALDAPLVTCDAKLDTDGHRAVVHVMPQGFAATP